MNDSSMVDFVFPANSAERLMRIAAVGRKAFQFVDSERAGHGAASGRCKT